jgi:Zn-dependent protease with chaperone function
MAESLDPLNQTVGDDSYTPTLGPIVSAEVLYQQGVSALKAKDYALALGRFQQLEQLETAAPTDRLKAQIGLVRVYVRLGNVKIARDRCQILLTSPSAKVRQWAGQTLRTLPLEPERTALAGSEPAPNHAVVRTMERSPDRTGFVPLEPQAPRLVPPPPPPVPQTPLPQLPTTETETVRPPTPASAPEQPEAPVSLFHYQQLNAVETQDTLELVNTAPKADSPSLGQRGRKSDPARETSLAQPRSTLPSFRPQPLPQRPLMLWGVQIVTAIATLWLINAGLHWVLQGINGLLRFLRFRGIPAFDQAHTGLVVTTLIIIALASPWLMDRGLAWGYGQRSLSTRQLQAQHPEILRLLRQVCRYQGWQLPELRLIPDAAPLCFSYGWLPHNTRIVISQGLLDTCSEEELTALYSYELAHIANWDLPVISAIGLGQLLLYTGYWRLARWGNTLDSTPARIAVGGMANGLYGLFWLLRKLVLWLSRVRTGWSDRRADALIQQPYAQQQSLLGLTTRISTHFQSQGALHPLLQSLDVLMPLNVRAAISPGSFLASVALPSLLADDSFNPYRQWLLSNASHQPTGARLLALNQLALKRGQPIGCPDLNPSCWTTLRPTAQRLAIPLLLLQKSPIVGLLTGGGIALGLWFIGGIVNRFGWQRLSWFYQDSSLLQGGLLLGLGLGLLLRINALYPDISPRLTPAATPGQALVEGGGVVPVQGQPIILAGRLTGAPGLANWVGQDLYLATSDGVVRLSATLPALGWQGFVRPGHHPIQGLGRPVRISGWQRRSGGLLWLDIAEIRLSSGQLLYTDHAPLWITVVSLGLSLWGIWVILTGG